MAKPNRVCILCHEEYSYCNHCPSDSSKPRWMVNFHSDNCRKIFNIVSAYANKEKTAIEAKHELELCDLSNKAKYSEMTMMFVEEILSAKEEVAPVVAENLVEEIKEETKEEIKLEKPAKNYGNHYTYKKKH